MNVLYFFYFFFPQSPRPSITKLHFWKFIPWNKSQRSTNPSSSIRVPYTINCPDYACLRVVTVEWKDGIWPRWEYHNTDTRLSRGNWKKADERFDKVKDASKMLSYTSRSIDEEAQINSWSTNWKQRRPLLYPRANLTYIKCIGSLWF